MCCLNLRRPVSNCRSNCSVCRKSYKCEIASRSSWKEDKIKTRQKHLPLLGENLEAVCNQNAEAHAGHIEHTLRHDKTHREEEVGCRDERQDDQREGLQEKPLMMA